MPDDHHKVLLVGWGAADWKVMNTLIDHALMSTTKRLVENDGLANLATVSPALSPMKRPPIPAL